MQVVVFRRAHNLFPALSVRAVAAGGDGHHTVAVTKDGRVLTFGRGKDLGHGGEEDELVPQEVEGLAGLQVAGAATCASFNSEYGVHTVVWTEDGKALTFGDGYDGRLGHGGDETELVPRVVEGLAGIKVVGAAAGGEHTVAWTCTGAPQVRIDASYARMSQSKPLKS